MRDSARHKRRDANNVAFDSLKPAQRERLASLTDSNPSPEDLALFADELRSLLERLDVEDPSQRLRQVAPLKLDGCTDREIALRMNCSRKTVCARTALIRVVWQSVGAS
jgi:DNA-binding NarL/FixJ family response regulator